MRRVKKEWDVMHSNYVEYPWINMEFTQSIKGLRIRYIQEGTGLPVVLLHGLNFHAETWQEISLFDELVQSYNVYAFDMPYGPKSKSDKFMAGNRDEYADFLDDMMKTLDIQSPILLGASISGEVTLRYLMHRYSARAGIVVGPVGIENMGAKLNKISVPLLAIWGERDTISPPAVSKILKSHLQNAVVHIIKEAGHPCYLDEPAKFKEIVRNFLKK